MAIFVLVSSRKFIQTYRIVILTSNEHILNAPNIKGNHSIIWSVVDSMFIQSSESDNNWPLIDTLKPEIKIKPLTKSFKWP